MTYSSVMKLGDLRRFKDSVAWTDIEYVERAGRRFVGRPFVILEMETNEPISSVSFLIDGRIEREWDGYWVEHNSEVPDGVS